MSLNFYAVPSSWDFRTARAYQWPFCYQSLFYMPTVLLAIHLLFKLNSNNLFLVFPFWSFLMGKLFFFLILNDFFCASFISISFEDRTVNLKYVSNKLFSNPLPNNV